jgi:hypothetical protein
MGNSEWSQRFREWANQPRRGFTTRAAAVLWGVVVAFALFRLIGQLFNASTSRSLRIVDAVALVVCVCLLGLIVGARRR